MKTGSQLFLLLIVACMLAIGCNQNDAKTSSDHSMIKYVAYREGDTAVALIEQSKSVFKGVLEIKYRSAYIDSGDVKGIIKGDTLIGDFHFKHYGLAKWNRKPIAFLKSEDKLILGEGVLKLTVGFPHFNPAFPIDYDEKKQFVFHKELK